MNQRRCSPPLDTEEIEAGETAPSDTPSRRQRSPLSTSETGAVTQSCDRPTLIVNMGRTTRRRRRLKILVPPRRLLYRRARTWCK